MIRGRDSDVKPSSVVNFVHIDSVSWSVGGTIHGE